MPLLRRLRTLLDGRPEPGARLDMLEQREAEVRGQATIAIKRAQAVLTADGANAARAAIRASGRRPAGK